MALNMTGFKENVTLDQVIDFFNLNISNVTNTSEVTQIHLFDLYEAYRTKEKEQLMIYKFVAYVIGTLIILSNLTVVVSSGLILRKGQQPKSTYLLLGNVSLADTIIGISVIFGASIDNSMSSNSLCIFQIGMLVCPAMVSIFSVGLIAVDRYIYILHGLYYQRWFNSTRVRIGILIIWLIGVILGFMPATGWVNSELILTRCYYVALFPGALILLNSLLSIIPIIVVIVLYSIILVKALKTVSSLNATEKPVKTNSEANNKPKLRMYRGTVIDKKLISTYSVRLPETNNVTRMKRSASFNLGNIKKDNVNRARVISAKSKSIDDIFNENSTKHHVHRDKNIDIQSNTIKFESDFSICTVESSNSEQTISIADITKRSSKLAYNISKRTNTISRKIKEPNKWRAITVVLLTSGSFIIAWMPFFITVTLYVFCEEKLTNPKCKYLRHLLGGPMATLAFVNSILNPLIYAWWHKGFQRYVRTYYRKYFCK